jgi:hypothetical protein
MTGGAAASRLPAQAIAAIAGIVLAGCTAAPGADVNLVGFSAAFKQGYRAGCDDAGAPRPRRDASRYRKEPEYRQGWDDGNSACSCR